MTGAGPPPPGMLQKQAGIRLASAVPNSGKIATILSCRALNAAPLKGEPLREPRGLNQGFVNLKRLETILGSVGRSIEGAAYYG